jgi:sugar phosphate isomerase/epimerase
LIRHEAFVRGDAADMLDIGVMLNNLEPDRLKAFAVAKAHGFQVVHTNALLEAWLSGPQRSHYIAAARQSGIRIDTMFVGFDGQSYVDWQSIAQTVGLIIPQLREHRCRIACLYSDLAQELDVPALAIHLGFLPKDQSGADYRNVVEAVRDLADYCAARHQTIRLETGQESAEGLLRFLRKVARPNLGINFDPANFILYGTDDPVHALELLMQHIGGVHCKDALPSGQAGVLGREVPIGQGCVPFPDLVRKLRGAGYSGPFIIERESGGNVLADILACRAYLEQLLR